MNFISALHLNAANRANLKHNVKQIILSVFLRSR